MNESGLTARRMQNAEWLTQGSLARLLGVLSGDGEEARVVGGAVRNARPCAHHIGKRAGSSTAPLRLSSPESRLR